MISGLISFFSFVIEIAFIAQKRLTIGNILTVILSCLIILLNSPAFFVNPKLNFIFLVFMIVIMLIVILKY